jgi:type VII secretion-associated serine protease mycosin
VSRATPPVLAAILLIATAVPAIANEPAASSDLASAPVAGEIVPGEVVVKWRDAERGPEHAAQRGLAVVAEIGAPGRGLPDVVSTEGRPVEEVLAELRNDPAVDYAEPNYVLSLAEEPGVTAVSVNDPKTGPQYSLDRMRVRDAWAFTTGASGIVAVLDTGVEFGHQDLAGRVLPGHDFVNNDDDAADDNGHGTWVAGIIAANANDGIGIAGVSWRDRILPVKIMNANGTGDTSDLTSGIVWAADHGATVINMSVGGFPYSQFVHDAIRYAWSRDVVLVGAAGNNATDGQFFPASYPEVISVSATQTDDEFTFWSNYGPDVDVSAPGASVLTTNCQACKPVEQDISGDHRYTYISGTSFAAPNVAGVVALIRARYPAQSNAWVVDRLTSTVDDLGYAGWDRRYGHGRVNALRAVGGSSPAIALGGGDNLEYDNTLDTATVVQIGTTLRPNIYPAGDVDVIAVDVPRAGRLDVTVVPVIDSRAWPWHRSALTVDVVLNMYHANGTHIATVDNANPAATDRGSVQMGGPGRILLRVHNYTPNGNRAAYAISTAYVDNVGFTDTGASLFESEIDWLASAGITQGCSDTLFCPTSVVTREQMASFLARAMDLPATAGDFFVDDATSGHQADINRVAAAGVTQGCATWYFCPTSTVNREQMASFLVRALHLQPTTADFFTDDEGSIHEADINALAAAGVTSGCTATSYCPSGSVTREQMAAFLYRAFSH